MAAVIINNLTIKNFIGFSIFSMNIDSHEICPEATGKLLHKSIDMLSLFLEYNRL